MHADLAYALAVPVQSCFSQDIVLSCIGNACLEIIFHNNGKPAVEFLMLVLIFF
ncbi:hypothetical protein FHS86_000987 [Roseimarinus sediminis]